MADFGPILDEELPLGNSAKTTGKIQTLTDIDFYGSSHSIFSVNILTFSKYTCVTSKLPYPSTRAYVYS